MSEENDKVVTDSVPPNLVTIHNIAKDIIKIR